MLHVDDHGERWYEQHNGTHPYYIQSLQNRCYREWREVQYQDLLKFLADDEETEYTEITCCKAGRHHSVAWAWVKRMLAESLGMHVPPTCNLLHPTWHYWAYHQTPCLVGGVLCQECNPDILENYKRVTTWYLDEFQTFQRDQLTVHQV